LSLPAVTLPTTEDEHWRYSRIAELDLDRWSVAPTPEGGSVGVPPVGERAALAVVVDGRLVATEIDDDRITIEAGGVRTRPDLFVQLPNGQNAFLEIKTGPYAGPTPNQATAFPQIWTQGGTP